MNWDKFITFWGMDNIDVMVFTEYIGFDFYKELVSAFTVPGLLLGSISQVEFYDALSSASNKARINGEAFCLRWIKENLLC